MLTQDGVLTLCINLPRDTARRAHMTQVANRAQLPVQFFPAIAGAELDDDLAAYGFDAQRARRSRKLPPSRNEIAYIVTYRAALRSFLQTPSRAALIMEDDIEIDPERIWDVLNRISWFDEVLGNWHALKLFAFKPIFSRVLFEKPEIRICASLNYTAGTQAIVYSREGAAQAVRALERFGLALDSELGRTWENGLRMFEVRPYPVALAAFPSSIATPSAGAAPKLSFFDMLAHGRWKLHGEVARRRVFVGQCLLPWRRRLTSPSAASR